MWCFSGSSYRDITDTNDRHTEAAGFQDSDVKKEIPGLNDESVDDA